MMGRKEDDKHMDAYYKLKLYSREKIDRKIDR